MFLSQITEHILQNYNFKDLELKTYTGAISISILLDIFLGTGSGI